MDFQLILQKAADWLSEESTSRAAALAGTAALGLLATGLRLLRRKPAERVQVTVDAPKGETVTVKIGERRDGS